MCVFNQKNGRRIMKKLSDKSVKNILSALASGEHLKDVSKKFDVAELTVGNIARGATHGHITGLTPEKGGVKYLRANKEAFVITKHPRAKAETTETTPATATPTVETPTVDSPIAVANTRMPRKSNTPRKKAGTVIVTVEDRAKAIKNDTVKIIEDLDASILDLDSKISFKLQEIEDMRKQQEYMTISRKNWQGIVSTMSETSNVSVS